MTHPAATPTTAEANHPQQREFTPAMQTAVQHWWNCDDKAVAMVKEGRTLSLCFAAIQVALNAEVAK